MVEEIARIGKERAPCEACGLLLPIAWRGKRVWELPNRSKTPHDSFTLTGTDIMLELEDFIAQVDDQQIWGEIVIWHTHPKGNLGPSVYDMRNRSTRTQNLVVTLLEDADAKATWF